MLLIKEELLAKGGHSACVLILLFICVVIAMIVYSDMSSDAASFFGFSNNSEQDIDSFQDSLTLINQNSSTKITNQPSSPPTVKPTIKPTHNPTQIPTNKPSNKPTNNPTNKITPHPTNRPTNIPTNRHTINPTKTPTQKVTTTKNKNKSKIKSTETATNNKSDVFLSRPKLIIIGSTYSGALTIFRILCKIMDIHCCLHPYTNPALYDEHFDYTSLMLNNSVFLENDYIPNIKSGFNNSDFMSLSDFYFDIDGIFEHIPINKYLLNMCDSIENDNKNENILIMNPLYFQSPVTASIMAYFALKFDTKILYLLREPIDRWYSSDMHQEDVHPFNQFIDNQYFAQTLSDYINNESVNNDMILSLYYQWYFATKGNVDLEIINSFYCVHILNWIKQFDKILKKNSDSFKETVDYFKISQTRNMFADINKYIKEIYCWEHENCDEQKLDKQLIELNENNLIDYDMNIPPQNWPAIETKMILFERCNQRIDDIIKNRPKIVLGNDWKSFNKLYDEERAEHSK